MRNLLIVFTTIWASFFAAWAQQPGSPKIQMVVGITGEDGVVALKEGTVSMYSQKNIGIIPKGERRARLVESKIGVASLALAGSRWEQVQAHLSLSTAFAPGLCDRLNQINLSSTQRQISKALPTGARVKAVREEADMAVIIFSTSSLPVKYKIHIGLLQRLKNGTYSLINEEVVSEAGSFCGIQDAGNSNYYVLVDEPAGSSDYLTVYVYSLTK